MKQKALRAGDAHSHEDEECRKRPRWAQECAEAHSFLHVKITCRKFNKTRENLSKTVAYCIKSKYNIHGRKFDLIIKFIKMEG